MMRVSAVIIGSGISGLYIAIKLAETNKYKKILLVTKSTLRESNSCYAQGGIAGVLPENFEDSVDLHVDDTVQAGAGLTDLDAARFVSQKSSEAINDLINYGVEFDKDSLNKINLTLEAAHSVRRILHAGGDATGKSIELALSTQVENNPNIIVYEKTQAVELLIDSKNDCRGIIAFNTETGGYETVFSSAVIIATGGMGQVYSHTTNPKIATGDGLALAYRANAVIQDMEFVQFHPTALNIQENDTRFLISESARGEGARLRNLNNDFFTLKYDKRGDLAPRDVVTRSIFFEMRKTKSSHVFLDASLIPQNKMKKRFPNIIKACKDNGIDIFKQYIPVSPAAHYSMGGIKILPNGQTNVTGLFAVGEASCISLHGANRLASNSLLECVVISREVAEYLNSNTSKFNIPEYSYGQDSCVDNLIDIYGGDKVHASSNINELSHQLKDIMWKNTGIIRNQADLTEALNIIEDLKLEFNKEFKCANLEEYEFRSLLTVADLIIKSAVARKESRGAHFREDYPEAAAYAYHSYIRKGDILVKNESFK